MIEPEEGVVGNSNFIASWSEVRVTTWVLWLASLMRTFLWDPVGSAMTLRVGVRTELNCRMPREHQRTGECVGVGKPHTCVVRSILVL